MLWALGFDTRHCPGQPGLSDLTGSTRVADPALGTEIQAENTWEQSRQSKIKNEERDTVKWGVQWPYSWVGQ